MLEDRTQKADEKAPFLFAESKQTVAKKLETEINFFNSDDRNLADNYMIVLRDLKNIFELEKKLRL